MEIFVFKRFQPVLFGLFEFDLEMTLSVIDPINLRYRWAIAAKKGTCEPVANNLVTANWIARVVVRDYICVDELAWAKYKQEGGPSHVVATLCP
jgi:hypothetical protein